MRRIHVSTEAELEQFLARNRSYANGKNVRGLIRELANRVTFQSNMPWLDYLVM